MSCSGDHARRDEVPAQKLLNYLKLSPGGKVSMKVLANYQMQITCGHSRTKMSGLAPNSFPFATDTSI
jgi:DNA polymerase III sliding clamp (beta) subunit (PCNA family)